MQKVTRLSAALYCYVAVAVAPLATASAWAQVQTGSLQTTAPTTAQSADQLPDEPTLAAFWQQVHTGTIAGVQGKKLAYAWVMPANAKAAIVLVQGRTESYLKYQELFYQLSNAGYAVFTLDHRGQGLSERLLADAQIGHVLHFSDYQQDQFRFITEVVKAQTELPLLLLAHSMGGAVAAQMLAAEPQLFTAAVLSSAMIAPNASLGFSERDGCRLASLLSWTCQDCYAGYASQAYHDQPFAENILTRSNQRYLRFRQLYAQQPALQLGGPSWRWLGEACAVSEQMPALASAIKTPVLMLQSGAEQAVSNAAQQQFCQQLGDSCAGRQVVQFPAALHELMFEQDDTRSAAIGKILQFYQQHLPGGIAASAKAPTAD